jgi:hypothetical protein
MQKAPDSNSDPMAHPTVAFPPQRKRTAFLRFPGDPPKKQMNLNRFNET